ncbi:MAG: hypothetical protein BAJATHORv1_20108 [Candidatus Thorarchaeota archaeon]|nr:MAG: hypothetical protein BAJATHORv1_20108 [Candidatus Thorarchaeota archaeon]
MTFCDFVAFKRSRPFVIKMPKIERIKKRHLLKKRDQRDLLEYIENTLATSVNLDSKARFEEGVIDDGSKIIILNDEIVFIEIEERLFPTLRALLQGIIDIPSVTVDMGAVKFVANGADIMRPGITEVDEGIEKDTIVSVIDERHGKPLAIGVSTLGTEELRAAESGKVIISKHYIGDDLWEYGKS